MSTKTHVKNWKENIRELLKNTIRHPYNNYLEEFVNFLEKLCETWQKCPQEIKEKYAYHLALLQADSNKLNVIRAKINAYYAYLVFKGYTTVYRLIRNKFVAGGESIYTWLRLYRDIAKYSNSHTQ